MFELVDPGGKIFMFLFSVILFHTTGETTVDDTQIEVHQLHFMELLRQHIIFQAMGDHQLAAIQLGIVNECITKICE